MGSKVHAARIPWTRVGLAIAVGGPALCIGGVPPETVPAFLFVVFLLWNRICARSSEQLAVPIFVWLGFGAAAVTLLQWVPIAGMRELLAPGLAAEVAEALEGTGAEAWPGVTATPADTGLEVARMFGLATLAIAAAQLSWRQTAAIVAGVGTLVALIGLLHEALGLHKIYGIYEAQYTDLEAVPALVGTFVNPNHQSGLLLLAIFAAGGLAADQHAQGLHSRDPSKVDKYGDRFLASMAALAIMLPALLLSLSRGAIVALVLVTPVALIVGLRHQRPRRGEERSRFKRLSAVRLLVIGGFLALAALVAQHGAWKELSTLRDFSLEQPEAEQKLRIAMEAPALLSLSPALGIGRGSFIDLFSAIDSQPDHSITTHLESAPAAMIVELGPLFGGVLAIGLLWWWVAAMLHGGHRDDRQGRRIVLLGLLALALQSLGDFSLEFLGVGAPAVALGGALSPPRYQRWNPKKSRWVMSALLVAMIGLSWWARDDTWTRRESQDAKMLTGERTAQSLLAKRPLDGRLHTRLARLAAERGDWNAAQLRADVAAKRHPGSVDAWLLKAAAHAQLGEPHLAESATARGLDLLHKPPAEDLIDYLILHHPDPDTLVRVAPQDDVAWKVLVAVLVARAPAHADALASARQRERPELSLPRRFRRQDRVAGRKRTARTASRSAAPRRRTARGDVAPRDGRRFDRVCGRSRARGPRRPRRSAVRRQDRRPLRPRRTRGATDPRPAFGGRRRGAGAGRHLGRPAALLSREPTRAGAFAESWSPRSRAPATANDALARLARDETRVGRCRNWRRKT